MRICKETVRRKPAAVLFDFHHVPSRVPSEEHESEGFPRCHPNH